MPVPKDFFNHIEIRPEFEEKEDGKKGPVKGEVEFKNVHFSYDGEEKVLNGINFHVSPRKSVALVGPSGAGKTSIIRLNSPSL